MSEEGCKWVSDSFLVSLLLRVLMRYESCRPFALITGTVVGLIVLIGASVSLLSSVGNQELPSVLLAGVSAGERKD
jgi:Domain of unknown function (DUF3844)